MAGIQGAIGEYKDGSSVLGQGRLRLAFDEEIYKLNIDKAMLLGLLSKMGKDTVGRDKFYWQNKERKADSVTPTAVGGNWASGADDDGTITVGASDKYLFAEGDVIRIPEVDDTINLYVSAVNQSTGVITAETVGGGNINLSGWSTEVVFRVANSFEIGSGKGTIISQQPSEVYNLIQIVQTPVGITTSARHYDYRGKSEWDEQTFEAGVDHAFKLEKLLFLGERKENSTGLMDGVYPQHLAGGLRYYISTNVTDAGGALTQAEFGTFVKNFTKYAKMPVVFAGELIYEGLTTWTEQKLEVMRSEDTLGMAVSNYLTPYGDRVKIMPHRELLTGVYQGIAFGVDMSNIKYISLKGLDTHLETEIQQPDLKQRIDEFRTWISLKMINEKQHGLLYGATSISTS